MNKKEKKYANSSMNIKEIDKKYHIEYAENNESYISTIDAEMDRRAVEAVKAAKQKAMICKNPIAKYDAKSKRAYLEYSDGSIKYVD